METDPKKRYKIEFKSILLDIIEKYKTFERVNLALFIRTFQHDQKNQHLEKSICSQILKPLRLRKSVGDPYDMEEDENESHRDSMQLESIFLNDMPVAKKKLIESLRLEYMGQGNYKRLEMLKKNPNLPDGLLLKFRKCNFP